ncbi:MAG: hypothetical protein RBG13Loki_0566 [Promethearchaeota archaeon CR_4]|nr:MAG: hypothetical protein RBG13Loki_0566 [Candidatus Lokiarchaeota archaeon CR_4]
MVKFTKHPPKKWYGDKYKFSPELHFERYNLLPACNSTHLGPNDERQTVYLAHVGILPLDKIATYNYSTSYRLTQQLLAQVPNAKGGKVLVKPNNTGFVGLFFNNSQLREILLNKKGMQVDADHQAIATQPAVVAGIVDALLQEGVREVHVGENMLWEGGTPRAFWETGYTQYFSQERYDSKVFFVDFYEADDTEVLPFPIAQGPYDLGGFTKCHPPKALFDEHYTLILSAAIAKIHNCAYYTLATKNFSVSWNPRRPMRGIPPRWHIHGLPANLLDIKQVRHIIGADFRPKFSYKYKNVSSKEQIQQGNNPNLVALCTDTSESDPIKTYMSCGQRVVQVDPHHHAGANLVTLNLGMQYLVVRYTGIFATMLQKLGENGTRVATVCSGIVGQEGEGPLVYGSLRYGGFNVAGFNHAGVEAVGLDIMLGKDPRGAVGFLDDLASSLEKEYKFSSTALHNDAQRLWTLELLHNLTGGEIDQQKIPIEYMDFSQKSPITSLDLLYTLRPGRPFTFTDAFYCNPKTWLRLIHTEKRLYKQATKFVRKGVEIPLIPGVVN